LPKLRLYKHIYDIENLYKASRNALKNKKSKHSEAKFWLGEDKEDDVGF